MSKPTTAQDDRFPGGNYLDWLMALDPLELSAQNIDEIIAAHRAQRTAHIGGGKAKRLSSTESVTLDSIGLASKPGPVIKRRKV